ncbi:hypothetical protein GWO43_03615 [candidate division KSB1 bacterium]|nr:hypothetical protein [candidate division KSB1 bacterium]NIR70427.1 hypothetical protein [candidate division KSB1 bacterium]NIS25966.1 hypothetical protein [candidate division KSB1 bacterium]NIT69989.1 hypothetical protein [candidate division KSB1 bacterium]NIU26655.1 hypothetical protein [candidate division KSB1 bacterium]
MKRKYIEYVAGTCFCLLLLFIVYTGCSLDVTNPNSASEEQVLTTQEGLQAVGVAMQSFYATTSLEAYVLFTGTTSREVAINTTFQNLIDLEAGGNQLDGNNGNVAAVWARSYRVIRMASDLLENVPNVQMAAGTRSGLIALASLYKAMALGALAQAFEQAPLDVQAEGQADFQPRSELLAEAIQLCNDGLAEIDAQAPSSAFNANVLGSGFDLRNTLQAYRARYNLFAGNNQQAIEAANAVDPNATSVFTYDALNTNPIYDAVFIAEDWAPRDDFGVTVTEPGDGRLTFYMVPKDTLSDPNGLQVEELAGFFATQTSPIPAYLPGEMPLIRAEAMLNEGDIPGAITEINSVRTKTAAEDPFGVGAGLAEYSGPQTEEAVREEIFRQRRAELFLSGVSLEDSRRLDRPGPSSDPFQRNRNFYPYPTQERLNNPNTPADPAN